jgi:hypothetical protein
MYCTHTTFIKKTLKYYEAKLLCEKTRKQQIFIHVKW